MWRGWRERLRALRPLSGRDSLRLGTLWATRPLAGVSSPPGAVAGRFPEDSGLSADPLSVPGRAGETARLCLFLPCLVRGLGPACQAPGRGRSLLSRPGTPRRAAGPGPTARAGGLGSPHSAFPGPARPGGRRRVRPGGAVPYFTRCRAGVRRSSDK